VLLIFTGNSLFQMEGLGCVKVIDEADFSDLGFPCSYPAVNKQNKHPLALILQPTRELAIQVKDHLQVAAAHTDITVCSSNQIYT
jgi:superfamily II DNA/RNA helicase